MVAEKTGGSLVAETSHAFTKSPIVPTVLVPFARFNVNVPEYVGTPLLTTKPVKSVSHLPPLVFSLLVGTALLSALVAGFVRRPCG
jgi:hypothetical protein